MRGAGCTLNDIADRNFDGKVERTKSRPIPSGRVAPLMGSTSAYTSELNCFPRRVETMK